MAPKSKPASVNELPVAAYTFDANNLTVTFDASASYDPDGSIADYSWDFGDNTAGIGKLVTHTYPFNGTYNTTLLVADNGNAKNTTSKEVTVKKTVTPPPPVTKKPVAVIKVVSIVNLTVSLNGSDSKAFQSRTIASYAWSFGDSSSATGAVIVHTYAANGTYTVTLTVTDSGGAANSSFTSVTVKKGVTPVLKPVAMIDLVSNVNLTIIVNGSESTAPQGRTIVSYEWTFGDGTNGTGVNVTHTYAVKGTYTVTLTVTDSQGETNSSSIVVIVKKTPPPPPPEKQGPPGLLHAIEIHRLKADRNAGLQNSLDHLIENLDRWLSIHGLGT